MDVMSKHIKDKKGYKSFNGILHQYLSTFSNQIISGKESRIRENQSPMDTILDNSNTYHNDTYNQKLPISFISPKDWQKYIRFTNFKIDNVKKDLIKNQRGKNARISRLLNSFHQLYQEYSQICTKYTPRLQCAGDTTKISSLGDRLSPNQIVKDDYQIGDKSDLSDSENDVPIDAEVQTVPTLENMNEDDSELYRKSCYLDKDLDTINTMSRTLLPWGIRNIVNPAKRLSRRLKQVVANSEEQKGSSNDGKYFDKIVNLENNIDIEVIEEIHQRFVIDHKLSLQSMDRKRFKLSKQQAVQIPLAVELLLPKIQRKIENILYDCPFLCDPLEVAAELRQFGYDKAACIKYFNMTKSFRSIIEEMMPSNTNNEDDQPMRSMMSSVLSRNSQTTTRNTSNDTITLLYSKSDKIKKSVNKLFPFTNKSPYSFKKSPDNIYELSTTNGITQTSKVHFYMDDKNMESFFYEIKHYICIIRQLHSETHEEVKYLQKQLCCLFTSLKSHMSMLVNQNNDQLIFDEQKSKMVTLSQQVEELKLKLKKEEKKRRQVYNLMHEQMGNIRVYCRSRHIQDGGNVLEFINNESVISPIISNEIFEFDKVFQPNMSQSDVYDEFKPLVMSFIDGYNVCFITYGGEASGKTYTLIGGNEGSNQQGLMQRALSTILIEEDVRHRDWDYKVTACVVEIYNDNCIDVLSGETNIQLYVDNGMETAYQKLKSVPITNEADADALMQVCRVKRKIAKTALNPTSSRSHLITLIRLQGRSRIHGENICSFLCLCDLAGFEDIIKAETQTNKVLSKEAGYINRSLTAFNRVFVSLRKQDPNTVSYRDTKLTHLLKPFLTNSGKCALIVTVRNDKRSIGSTQNTLRFGRETRGVTLGKARRQVNLTSHISVL